MDTPTGSPNETCTVTLTLNDASGGKMKLELAESYDTVFNKISPLSPPTSALEMRQIMQHTLRNGMRVCFAPGLVAVLEEDEQ